MDATKIKLTDFEGLARDILVRQYEQKDAHATTTEFKVARSFEDAATFMETVVARREEAKKPKGNDAASTDSSAGK